MSVRDLTERWRTLKKSDVACRGEDLDALKAMSHEDLALLAWEALNTVERLEEYDYIQGALEDHLEGPGDFCEGWVVSQASKDGSWNKWVKTQGGLAHTVQKAREGDALVYFTWDEARSALKDMKYSEYYRIYPVVVSAGKEPRTTKPRTLP